MSCAPELRLYVVVALSLAPGARVAQAVHAAFAFAAAHPAATAAWTAASNTIAVVGVRDETALAELLHRAGTYGLATAAFREPDLGDALTAVALGPDALTARLCRGLPLLA